MGALPDWQPDDMVVTPETYEAYCREAESYRADRTRDLERDRNRASLREQIWMALAVLGVGFGAYGLTNGHPMWGILSYDTATGRVGVVQQLDRTEVPPPVERWLLTRMVELREGFNEAQANSDFAAVACMSSPDEQKAFAAWYNTDPTAPQQIFAKARNHGFRTAVTLSDPTTVGRANDGAPRYEVRFSYRDRVSAEAQGKQVFGTATFTVRKGARTACNPAGLVVSDYERKIDREIAP